MNLKKLIADLPIEWITKPIDIPLTGLCSHSKSVAPGNLFISKSSHFKYLDEALIGGATAILSTDSSPLAFDGIVQLKATDLAAMELALAERFYPWHDLTLCAITGTNGKTTTSFLIKHLVESLGAQAGVIGTIAYLIGERRLTSSLTTPDVITLRRLLCEMSRAQCQYAIMETSSHGLVQKRTEGLDFKAAIFTNLTQDHLDYHHSMEKYADAKQLLFNDLKEDATAIVNADSPYAAHMLKQCLASPLLYGFTPQADLFATELTLTPQGSTFYVNYRGEKAFVSIPLAGRFNILNTLAAIAFCLSQGKDLQMICNACPSFGGVPGRLESISNRLGLHVFVDYAHTPDALEQVCQTLQECIAGQLLVVFGAGGDRDKEKRPLMGKVADRYADFAIVTSDNPRSEPAMEICEQIAAGFQSKKYRIELNRQQAIAAAIEQARPGDTILIAGKGHECYQIIGHQTLPFNDRDVAERVLEEGRCS